MSFVTGPYGMITGSVCAEEPTNLKIQRDQNLKQFFDNGQVIQNPFKLTRQFRSDVVKSYIDILTNKKEFDSVLMFTHWDRDESYYMVKYQNKFYKVGTNGTYYTSSELIDPEYP